jgi:methylphosphotriester-DNA--protein-cysteine methyltransferase
VTAPAYREHRPDPALRAYLECAWVRRLDPGEDPLAAAILPDGHVDIVLFADGRALVAGVDTAPVKVTAVTDTTVAGLRLAPGAARAVLGVPASELRDARCDLADLWGDDDAEAIAAGGRDAGSRLECAQAVVRRRLGRAPDPDPAVAAISRVLRSRGGRVTPLAERCGLSDRQLRRRFHDAIGYGPKTYERVTRFQRMLHLAQGATERVDLAALAVTAGYADQAHMTAECSRLGGAPPARLLAARGVRFLKDGAAPAP